MATWRIKEISDMTDVSIRMLRHYDKIGLLKPSYRSANGYRCYTEADLAVLQQVISLKYFGFSLNAIKTMLDNHQNVYAHLKAQQKVLQDKSTQLQEVTEALDEILTRLSPSDTPDFNDSVRLISRYHMNKEIRNDLKASWAGKVLNEEQFDALLSVYEAHADDYAARKAIFEEINQEKVGDPDGPDGERIISRLLDIQQKMRPHFSKLSSIGSTLLKEMQSGKMVEMEVSSAGQLWLSRATLSYWLKRWDRLYDKIVENLNEDPTGDVGASIAHEWEDLINEHFMSAPRAFTTGLMIWENTAKQAEELSTLDTMPPPKELASKVHVKLVFNTEALAWVTQALEVHASSQ